MAVAVQGHGRRLVTELSLDRLDAGALGDGEAGGRVAKVMGAERLGQSRPASGRLELAVKELPLPQRATHGRGEHQGLRIVRSAGQVGGQLVAEEGWQPEGTPLVGL